MRLTDLFEDSKERKFLEYWASVVGDFQADPELSGSDVSTILSMAKSMVMTTGKSIEPQDAISQAATNVRTAKRIQQRKATARANAKNSQPKATKTQPTRDKVKPTITTPDADRTRKDALGRNLKADRYYNQLNKSQRGRNIIKQVSQKLGLPPEADEVIDYIADTMPTVIQKLDTILTNPADIGGRLNPRNRRK